MGVYVFDFDCLRGASEDSKVIIKHNDKEMIIDSLSTDKDGNVIVKVFEDWSEVFDKLEV